MNNAPNQVPRFSNIEASRILAMFLIVAHHFAVHGGVPIWKGDFPNERKLLFHSVIFYRRQNRCRLICSYHRIFHLQ